MQETAACMRHNVFENQEKMQFPGVGFYGIPEMKPSQATGQDFLRFADWKEVDDPETKDGRWVTMDEYMKNGGKAAKSTKKSTPKKKK